MDLLWQQYIGSIVRAVLIATGAITAQNADNNEIAKIAGAIMAIASVAWSMWQKRKSREVTVAALAVARVTENHVKALVADPAVQTPSPSTPPEVVPAPITLKAT